MKLSAELRELTQWILWRYEKRDGKTTKAPYTAMGYRASITNPNHWSRFDYLLKLLDKKPDFANGLGFVFTSDDPFCGVDLDNCYLSDAAECAPWAAEIIECFSDTYSEESPSATGVKIWCRAKAPRCGKWPVRSGAIEIYDHARYFVVTGKSNGIEVIADHQADIESLVAYLDDAGRPRCPYLIASSIPRGKRHDTLLSLAGSMFYRGMCAEAIEAALLKVNAKQCDPPHTVEHVRQIVRSMGGWQR